MSITATRSTPAMFAGRGAEWPAAGPGAPYPGWADRSSRGDGPGSDQTGPTRGSGYRAVICLITKWRDSAIGRIVTTLEHGGCFVRRSFCPTGRSSCRNQLRREGSMSSARWRAALSNWAVHSRIVAATCALVPAASIAAMARVLALDGVQRAALVRRMSPSPCLVPWRLS